MKHRRFPLLFFYCILFCMGVANIGSAAEWTFSESISLSEAYTDNVDLVETDTEGRWATIISPNMAIHGKGRRLNVGLVAAWHFVSGSEEEFYPNMRAFANSELVEDHFFLDVVASSYIRTIDPLKPAGTPINRTGNLTTTYSVGVHPYYIQRFSDIADLRIDYSYTREFNVSNKVSDRLTPNFTFSLNSGRYFSAFSWGVRGRYSETRYDDDSRSNATFRSLDLVLGYRLSSHLSLNGSVGKEWNDYETSGSRDGTPKWSVGATWAPNPRYSVTAGYSYRFFGHHPYVSLSYRHKRSVLRLRYSQDLESGYQPLDQQKILAEKDLAGNPIDPFEGGIFNRDNTELASLYDNGANVNERLNVDYLLSGKRTSFGMHGSYSDRVYENSPKEILEWRIGFNINRQLGRRLSVDARTNWYRTEDETDFQADTWDLGFGVSRPLGNNTSLRFSYTYSKRDSNKPNDNYTENRVALVLNTSMIGLAKKAGL